MSSDSVFSSSNLTFSRSSCDFSIAAMASTRAASRSSANLSASFSSTSRSPSSSRTFSSDLFEISKPMRCFSFTLTDSSYDFCTRSSSSRACESALFATKISERLCAIEDIVCSSDCDSLASKFSSSLRSSSRSDWATSSFDCNVSRSLATMMSSSSSLVTAFTVFFRSVSTDSHLLFCFSMSAKRECASTSLPLSESISANKFSRSDLTEANS
mmetsp:Transcript_838/g.3123  ORF Transcript_838/g.3123 Transcript_838/m.3123 type:complete len:214 (-) Transcript_838:2663-3304(-)